MNEPEQQFSGDLRLLILNTQEPERDTRLTRAVAEGFAVALGPDRVHLSQYANACALFRKARCNSVLLLNGRAMQMAIVQELLRLSPRNILWSTADPHELPVNIRQAAGIDYIFTNDQGSLEGYTGKAHHLPPAAWNADEPIPLKRRYRDVFFAGAAWPNRVAFLRDLIPRLDGVKIQFLCPRDEDLPRPALPIPECEWNIRISYADQLTAARYSKVVLYLEKDRYNNGPHGRALSPGESLFETAAAGVAQIAISDEASIGPYFEPGKEILLAHSAEEAAAMIRELLADPARLEALGQAARKRVLAEHLYTHRVRTILSHLADAPVRRPGRAKAQPLRVLMVAHGVRGQRPWGGTELHVDRLRQALGSKYDSHLLYTSPHGSGRSMVHRHPGSGRQQVLYSGPYDWFRSWVDPRRDAAFQKLLIDEEIHLVHFVHFLYHSLGYVEVARSLGRPTVLGLYDFFIACPQFNLLDSFGKFCGLPAMETCDRCLARMKGLHVGTQGRRRALLSEICATVDRIHFLSHSQRSLIERALPIPADKVFVQGLGIDGESIPQSVPLPVPPLRIAVLGNHAHNKGADTLLAIIQQLAVEKFRFRIAGTVDRDYEERLEALPGNSVELIGPYEPEHLGAILQGCHVALFASPWPETFMLTLSEAMHAGAVPVGPNLGAYGERVRDGENGLVVPGDVNSYVGALESLLHEPGLLEKLRSGVRATHVVTIDEDAAGFQKLYEGLAAEYGLPGDSRPGALESKDFAPIVTTPVGASPSGYDLAAKSTLQKVLRIYKTQGAHAVLRRAWQRTSNWVHFF